MRSMSAPWQWLSSFDILQKLPSLQNVQNELVPAGGCVTSLLQP
jgi:hypothetical protein